MTTNTSYSCYAGALCFSWLSPGAIGTVVALTMHGRYVK